MDSTGAFLLLQINQQSDLEMRRFNPVKFEFLYATDARRDTDAVEVNLGEKILCWVVDTPTDPKVYFGFNSSIVNCEFEFDEFMTAIQYAKEWHTEKVKARTPWPPIWLVPKEKE